MGEFITRGMALGFLAGASTALIARRHAVLKKHPNLLGFAVAGTVDALSRDYRRPVVYDKLMKLDSPLSSKAKSILYSIRTGLPEEPPTLVNIPKEALYKPEGKVIETEWPKPAHSEQQPDEHGWWDAPSSEHVTSDSDAKDGAPELNQFGYPIQLPPGGPLNGTKTWADIRRESQSKRD